jgi:hypothetical protein
LAILDEYLLRYRHFDGQSSRRYHKLRTDTERHFAIMDLYLENGGRQLATAKAITAYESHRSEDFLMIAINHYILEDRAAARIFLSKIKAYKILKSPRVQRGRLLILLFGLRILVRIPRVSLLAYLFHRRWHVKKFPA